MGRLFSALLFSLILPACGTPDWVPTGRAGPDSQECTTPTPPLCAPDDIWFVATLKLQATHKGRDPIVAECGDGVVITNSCGWFKARMAVGEALRGPAPANGSPVLGTLGERCNAPRFTSRSYLISVKAQGRFYREVQRFEMLETPDGQDLVDENFAYAFGLQDSVDSIPASTAGRSGVRLRDVEALLPSLCAGETSSIRKHRAP
jgi:hypothetical protein